MATLTRTYSFEEDTDNDEAGPALPPGLSTGVPAPFRREELVEPTTGSSTPTARETTTHAQESTDLNPSITLVQRSCITTLNNLLSTNHPDWQPIVPDRRHSMPTTPTTPSASYSPSSAALRTLLINLRNSDSSAMIQVKSDPSDSEMLTELDSRINQLHLSEPDAVLAKAILSLLRNFNRLSLLGLSSSSQPQHYPPPLTESDLVETLRHFQRTTSSQSIGEGARTPVQQVEAALLWSNIEHELEQVATMCKERNHAGALPPQYLDHDYLEHHHDDDEDLPEYEYSRSSMSMDDHKSTHKASSLTGHAAPSASEEKTRLDLEAVAMAIDRLYMVAPQLSNQRVELREGKRAEMERASKAKAASSSASKGKGKAKLEDDTKDLENMLELLNKASERKYMDQAFVMDAAAMRERLERAKLKDDAQRADFMHTLALHSSAGRLHNQDFLPPSARHRQKDPEMMLTLPEFIREALPKEVEQRREDERMMTLPEFVRELPPHVNDSHNETPEMEESTTESVALHKRTSSLRGTLSRDRSKSLSSVTFPWLRSRSNSGSGNNINGNNTPDQASSSKTSKSKSKSPSRRVASRSRSTQFLHSNRSTPNGTKVANGHSNSRSISSFKTTHLAEAHHSLRHVLVFLKLEGNRREAGGEVEGEVVRDPEEEGVGLGGPTAAGNEPTGSGSGGGDGGGTNLIIRYGSQVADPPIKLPARCVLGKEEVKVKVMSAGTWFEVRVGMVPSKGGKGNELSTATENSEEGLERLMDAHQLANIKPMSFICSSCSLPLISLQSSHPKASSRPPSNHSSSSHFDAVQYLDLPSTHWEELLESWMCHPSQKLNQQVVTKSKEGFIPSPNEVLVGKSFLLLNGSLVVEGNTLQNDEKRTTASMASHSFLNNLSSSSQIVRCLCGAIVGRSQEQRKAEESSPTKVYRLLKYAMRPVSPFADPIKIPLSAYLIHDMLEYVDAHASYRFVLLDEEEECARILLWLFKPSLYLSYTTQKSYAIPPSAELHCAKVLFKILSPAEVSTAKSGELASILSKYPMFPAAEYLYYPMNACHQVSNLLKESNSTYPEGMRTMTGLDVGWLRRS